MHVLRSHRPGYRKFEVVVVVVVVVVLFVFIAAMLFKLRVLTRREQILMFGFPAGGGRGARARVVAIVTAVNDALGGAAALVVFAVEKDLEGGEAEAEEAGG
jgi:hypothetical protein